VDWAVFNTVRPPAAGCHPRLRSPISRSGSFGFSSRVRLGSGRARLRSVLRAQPSIDLPAPRRDDVDIPDDSIITDPSSSYRAIENLIATYAELVDDGDFAGVGILLADATFTGATGSVSGRDAIEKMLRDNVIVYDDGTPRTKHVTTNVAIELDEAAGSAVSRSYFTALQALPGLPLQPIVSGRYHDHFERRDRQWRFVERRVRTDLVGNVSRHLRRTAVR
jgi:hypothetical protein